MTQELIELLEPCRECGAKCRIEKFGGPHIEGVVTLFVCSNNQRFGGDCLSDLAYFDVAAWNARSAPNDMLLASVKESLEDVFYDTLNCGFDSDLLARAAIEATDQSQSARIAELEGENADLRERCEVVKITVDHKPFTALRHTCGFRIMALVSNSNGYNLAREIMGGAQAEDIYDLHMPLTVNEGDSFVTFPTARFG